MKREIFSIILLFALVVSSSLISGEIVISQEPKSLYNLGDAVEVVAKIVTVNELITPLVVSSICNGVQTSVRSQDIFLSAGQEETINLKFLLTSERLGRTNGKCVVKFALQNGEFKTTSEFSVSDKIDVKILSSDNSSDPGRKLLISGEAIKQNGEAVKNGFAELTFSAESNNTLVSSKNTVQNGFFELEYSLAENLKAGDYFVNIEVYELDSKSQKTNKGFASAKLKINQVPTSLEIVLENMEILPGTNVKIKPILYDQTGVKIKTSANVQILNPEGEIQSESETPTDSFLEYSFNRSEPPANWKIISTSEGLSDEENFRILENKKVSVEFLNRTILVTNIGNVFYNDTLLVKLDENTSTGLEVLLDVDKNQKYVLTAPEGNYSVKIFKDGEVLFNENLFLTGYVVGARELSERTWDVIQYPIVWVFFILVLGFAVWVFFKRVYKKSFFGRGNLLYKKRNSRTPAKSLEEKQAEKVYTPKSGSLLINTQNIAELSLSIQGEKQSSSIICVQMKNPGEVRANKAAVQETMNKLGALAEENRAMIYENQGTILFIFAPLKTRTFKNELPAIIMAGKIKAILTEHNKLFKQKINFGISLNQGYMIVRQEGKNLLRFMVLGTLITLAKKLATLSDGEPLLSEDIRKNIMSDIKTEKRTEGDLDFHVVKEIRDQEERRKFVNDFVRKMKQQEQEKK